MKTKKSDEKVMFEGQSKFQAGTAETDGGTVLGDDFITVEGGLTQDTQSSNTIPELNMPARKLVERKKRSK